MNVAGNLDFRGCYLIRKMQNKEIFMNIDKTSYVPMYIQIRKQILEMIENKKLKEGDPILSENQLVRELGVSRMTIRQAINNLVSNGYLEKKRGIGTFLKKQDLDRIEISLNIFENFTQQIRRIGKEPSSKVKIIEKRISNKRIARILGIEEKEKILYIERLRFMGKTPLLLEQSYMLYPMFNDINIRILEGSKYEYIEKNGYSIKGRRSEIMAEIPSEYVSELLNLVENQPALKINSIAFLEKGKAFEYSETTFNQRKYRFTLKGEYKKN